MVRLVLEPLPSTPGRYAATLDGRTLCRSRQPFYTAARVLLAEGTPPETPLEAVHAGSTIVVLRSTVGEAAGWLVVEPARGRLRRIRFDPAVHGEEAFQKRRAASHAPAEIGLEAAE